MKRNYTNGQLVKALSIPGIFRGIGRDNELMVTLADYKRLERNKYAPWGRGELGGKRIAA